MKILITGANGFLGHYLVQQLLTRHYTVIATSKGECRLSPVNSPHFIYAPMDFTDPFQVHDVLEKYAPDIIIHAGAMSKPDECEQNQWLAYTVNTEATVTLLLNAAGHGSFFVFLSTDFVFNGETGMYREEDKREPVNFYGRSKLEAEEAVKEYEYGWAIVRTVLVYGKTQPGRSNLLTIVKEKLSRGETYKVVDDQVRTPTYVEDLAAGIISIIEKKAGGIWHLCGEDILTPYGMACKTAQYLGLDQSLIKRVTAADFTQPAKRPPKTGLVIEKAKKLLGFYPLSFEEGMKKTFE